MMGVVARGSGDGGSGMERIVIECDWEEMGGWVDEGNKERDGWIL